MLDRVQVSDFESCLGDTFQARAGDGPTLMLELIEAKALEPRPGLAAMGIREDPFSLMFRASALPQPKQGTFVMEHPRLGTFALFLSPVGYRRPTDPVVFQAVFG